MHLMHSPRSILFLSSLMLMANAFSLSVGTPSECDPFTISWTGNSFIRRVPSVLILIGAGGTNPFEIYTFPVNDTPRSYSVPSSAYSGNQGSYTISQFPIPQGKQFVLVMSDATGFATVGTTGVMTVAASTSGSSCNTAFPYQFNFSLTGSLDQCESYTFFDYPSAILPVYFVGIIPSGKSFVLQSDVTTAEYSWTVEVQTGTAMMFSMFDHQNNTGGCTVIQTVGPSPSSDASCLSSSSPSSTAGISQTSQMGSPSSSTSLTSSSPSTSLTGSSSSTNLSTATIAGIVGGGVAALAVLVFLGLWFIQRKHKNDFKNSPSTPRGLPPLPSGDLRRDPDPFAIALAYQMDHVQPSILPGQVTLGTTHHFPQGTYRLPLSPTSLQGNPSTCINAPEFAAYDNMGISPVSPSASGWGSMTAAASPISTPDIVHTDVGVTPPTRLQVISPPPQYSELPGPGGQQSPLGPLP
ncbi:hypothetical protein EV401DRAFT_778335 [Pisolithus croceorrhizus]|nr:hypothetical protein EV401DRAFT_778335 [Pisolithus croceorrhizus]